MNILTKEYESYEAYIAHQMSKAPKDSPLRQKLLTRLWNSDCQWFRDSFKPFESIIKSCKNSVCLGARTGQEVSVLREFNLYSIGIDLIDSPPLVFQGDVHSLCFKTGSVNFIFSNILDHVLYPNKFISEIKRVLSNDGYCLLHLSIGTRHTEKDLWSCCMLPSSREIIDLFGKEYTILENTAITQKKAPCNWSLLLWKKSIQS